jgi:3'(2'), 5'-bisphosphate nucleotidase
VRVITGAIRQSCGLRRAMVNGFPFAGARFNRCGRKPGVSVSNFDSAARTALLEEMTAISIAAAEAIGSLLADKGVRVKADGSPVTAADEAAEAVIRDGLARLGLPLPVISEESADLGEAGIAAPSFILVDPLDGTREFIAGRNEYTINIGLVADGAPAAGVITAPALGRIWRGVVGHGAERLQFSAGRTSRPETIRTRPRTNADLLVMVSRSHLDAPTEAYLKRWPAARRVASGSALKFCRVAEGDADLYPRLGPTHDWDVAAGHAIVVAAGGCVLGPSGAPLAYGSAGLKIPAFLACGDPADVPAEA